MRGLDDGLERQATNAVHTSALSDRMMPGGARVQQGGMLYVDGRPVGVVHAVTLRPTCKGEGPAKKIGGSFSSFEPRGAEDPGNPPDVRA